MRIADEARGGKILVLDLRTAPLEPGRRK